MSHARLLQVCAWTLACTSGNIGSLDPQMGAVPYVSPSPGAARSQRDWAMDGLIVHRNPHVSFSWPRIMLRACKSTLVAPRPVLNVIRTLFMFSRNGSTSTRSQRLVVRCPFHSVLAEMELHKSALIEWVRTQHPHNSSGWQNHGNWI